MRTVLVDGSNISLHLAGRGNLTTLKGFARIVNCLLSHDILPYTLFDASFRYKTDENSPARADFERLTEEMTDFFRIGPSGEKADLFLLEAALVTGNPILSNDTYREYGGVRDGIIQYRGAPVAVYNFTVFAGAVLIPDLDIRHLFSPADGLLDKLAARIEAVSAGPPPAEAERGEGKAAQLELDDDNVRAIDEMLHSYVNGSARSLSALGIQLGDQKRAFLARAGLEKGGKRAWFGFPTLAEFIRNTYPRYTLSDNSIREGDGAGGA